MLEDVRNAGRILRRRLEDDPENLVLVIVDIAHHLGTGLLVPVEPDIGGDFGDGLIADEIEGSMRGHGLTRWCDR